MCRTLLINYITFDDIKRLGTKEFTQGRIEVAQKRSKRGSTFLSHSSKDKELLPVIIGILENHGATVYIDKVDPRLPEVTSEETAEILRNTIHECSKFILFVSPNSKDSKWIPWELGYADGNKNSSRTAIFPAVEKHYEKSWTEQEYLGLYERVIWGNFKDKESEWLVYNYQKNTAVRLKNWLNQ